MAIVRCIKECWDSKTAINYVPGDEADINPKDPIAKYFTGFPPGTKVYFKDPASKSGKTKIKEGFRTVPGPVKTAAVELGEKTIKELREIAKEYPKIEGPTTMKKDELLAAIKLAQNKPADPGNDESEPNKEGEEEGNE